MRRFLIAAAVAIISIQAIAADTVVWYGPDGASLKPGKYWKVVVAWKDGQPVTTQTVVLEVGGDTPIPPEPPTPPIPPTPPDVEAKISGFLSAVTDADKAVTAGKLAAGYTATLKFVDAGTINDTSALKTIQQQVDKSLLAGLKKTDAWKFWTDGMVSLVAAADLSQTAAIYRTAQAKLAAVGPTPPKPDPPKPDPPIPPTPSGLHVLIIDDENVRGTLPQEQINIFTSEKLMDYLDSKCVKESDGEPAYRFSSNDSLAPNSEARKLELKVWVEGWDAVMKAVADGKVKLPAWAVTNGTRGVIESLPGSVDAAIARIKEFE